MADSLCADLALSDGLALTSKETNTVSWRFKCDGLTVTEEKYITDSGVNLVAGFISDDKLTINDDFHFFVIIGVYQWLVGFIQVKKTGTEGFVFTI